MFLNGASYEEDVQTTFSYGFWRSTYYIYMYEVRVPRAAKRRRRWQSSPQCRRSYPTNPNRGTAKHPPQASKSNSTGTTSGNRNIISLAFLLAVCCCSHCYCCCSQLTSPPRRRGPLRAGSASDNLTALLLSRCAGIGLIHELSGSHDLRHRHSARAHVRV